MTVKIFKFSAKLADGNSSMKDELGGKGANLAEMASLGLPVPPGFTIPCSASVAYKVGGNAFDGKINEVLTEGLAFLEKQFDYSPLVSVRSGARVSMPGMMDTILNVGITTATLPFWKAKIGERAALDSYRRLIQMYGSVAMGVDMKKFEHQLEEVKKATGAKSDSDLSVKALEDLVESFKDIVNNSGYSSFPDTLFDQVRGATFAVFKSWDNPRAKEYRKINSIPESWGTAVTIQSMVFGNMNDKSATGVLFSRDPSTGERILTGEYLVNAQGEDVVAGIRTPESITSIAKWDSSVSKELIGYADLLEAHYKDMQDMEFTVQDGKLYILQTRNGKRSARAAFQIAYDLVQEGKITKQEAVKRIEAKQLYAVMQDSIDPSFKTKPDVVGIAAGGGIVSGVAMLDADSAVNCKEPCILVTEETDPDDIAGMNAARGILTATGGLTSHAAVVARGMNKTCVVGTTGMEKTSFGFNLPNGKAIQSGKKITIDGTTGNVWVGIEVPLIAGGATKLVREVVSWGFNAPVAERLELSPDLNSVEDFSKLLPETGTVYVDLCQLESSDRFSEAASHFARIRNLATALKTTKCEVILDLSSRVEYYAAGDGAFDVMFGVGELNEILLEEKKATSVYLWFGPMKSRVLVKAGDKINACQFLKDKGFTVMGQITTVADLMNDTQGMVCTPETISKIFGTQEAYEFVLKAIGTKTKKPAKPIAAPAYWYEAITNQGA